MSSVRYKGKVVAETVETPVKGIVTQAEFDALPVEQQNKGLYVIDDGAVGNGSNMGIYSTEEIRIGTWIDGKPIYRKVIKGTSQNDFILVSNVSEIITCYGYFIYNTLRLEIPFYSSTTNYFQTGITDGNAVSNVKGSSLNNPYVIVIEYTKTTDPEVTE